MKNVLSRQEPWHKLRHNTPITPQLPKNDF